MSEGIFSVEQVQKRKIQDLNRELLHARNLAENLREESKQAKQQVEELKTQLNNMEACYIEKKKEAEENLRCFRIAHDHGTERENKVKELQSRINDAERRGEE